MTHDEFIARILMVHNGRFHKRGTDYDHYHVPHTKINTTRLVRVHRQKIKVDFPDISSLWKWSFDTGMVMLEELIGVEHETT